MACPLCGLHGSWAFRSKIGLPAPTCSKHSMPSRHSARRLKLFLFGGAEGVAEAAAKALNESPGGLRCVGSIYPGFGTIEDMSQDRHY